MEETTKRQMQQQLKRQTAESYITTSVKSQQQSKTFVKKVICASVSMLCKHRIRLPDKYFTQRPIGEDLEVPILNPESVNDPSASITAQVFVTWLKSIFDAINHDYLKALVIGFYREKGNPATLFESYKFSINPDTKGLTISNTAGRTSYKSKDAQTLRGEVENLLIQFSDIDNELRALPSDSYITMRLIYHSKAPKEYQATGFVDDDKADLTIHDQSIVIDDEVNSGFHSIKAKLFAEAAMKASQSD